MLEEFLAYMNEQGWNIELNEKREMHLPKAIEERYTNIPQQWSALKVLKVMLNGKMK